MSKNCIGCGAKLQIDSQNDQGYTTDLTNDFCLRCFKIQNYGQYTVLPNDNNRYINNIKKIGKNKDLVLFVIDLLCIPNNIDEILSYLKQNKIILILNKKDILPNYIKEEKYKNYFKSKNVADIVILSAKNNYNFDKLLEMIECEKTSDKVYVIGNTNAGKSSIISKLIDLYTKDLSNVTISPLPSTTLDSIIISFKNYNLIDTPGLVDKGNILNYIDKKYIKKISPRKEIKPRTYRINNGQSIIIDNILRIDYFGKKQNSFTFFVSNELSIKKTYSENNVFLKDLDMRSVTFDNNQDIVINGLGFIKIINQGSISLYIDKNIDTYTRKSLI